MARKSTVCARARQPTARSARAPYKILAFVSDQRERERKMILHYARPYPARLPRDGGSARGGRRARDVCSRHETTPTVHRSVGRRFLVSP